MILNQRREIARVIVACLSLAAFGFAFSLPLEAEANGVSMLTISQKTFGNVRVLSPEAKPSAFVVLISGSDVASPISQRAADQLISKGAAVAIIDSRAVHAVLTMAPKSGQCVRLFGDVEDLVRLSERALDMKDWQSPVFFGLGDGATIAYLALAEGPPNSVAGIVSVGFSPSLVSAAPFCSGAPLVDTAGPKFRYGPLKLFGQWSVFANNPTDPRLRPFIDANPGATLAAGSPEDEATLASAIKSVFKMDEAPKASISDLPLTELPARNATGLAIFLSGDGGWRDIDKQIGEALSKAGVSVIGVDALRYFWSRKDPATIASDIDRIANHYSAAWHIHDVSLIGYSFGAATIPMVWSKLDPALQQRVKLVVMLAPEPVGRLQMSMSGWLGIRTSDDISLRPYLAEMPKDKVMCIYSAEEKQAGETGCTLNELSGATRIERTGGHHFGGDYQALAQLILERWALQPAHGATHE